MSGEPEQAIIPQLEFDANSRVALIHIMDMVTGLPLSFCVITVRDGRTTQEFATETMNQIMDWIKPGISDQLDIAENLYNAGTTNPQKLAELTHPFWHMLHELERAAHVKSISDGLSQRRKRKKSKPPNPPRRSAKRSRKKKT